MPWRQESWPDSPQGLSSSAGAGFRVAYTLESAGQEEMGVPGVMENSSARDGKATFNGRCLLAKD